MIFCAIDSKCFAFHLSYNPAHISQKGWFNFIADAWRAIFGTKDDVNY